MECAISAAVAFYIEAATSFILPLPGAGKNRAGVKMLVDGVEF